MEVETWLLYLLTCCGIALVPGPNALLVLTHGALHGNRRTLFTIAGGVTGFIGMIALCVLGLGVLLKTSMLWLSALKIVGGLYLIWLGIGLWRAEPVALTHGAACRQGDASLFRQGLLSAIANPKALLLFTAFITPFIEPQRSLLLQTTVMALTYAAVEFVVEFGVASAAHGVRPWLARAGRRFNRVCGGFFVAFGALLPVR
ncbi:TPA: LysE family translocator [Pseudomonas aeruginosa]|uniref:LysE family translocator n=1 Tax=Pseudomonas aeruginosa TaxID=287 RepID=UPI0009417207|nr:LysE family translocator [Pseudomonas aeruginosa]ELK4906602.1 LysE family translocator [Pseudomonas aeruginosa]MBG6611986.1 LysE family translocator [Pseudomonas aeruginosa]MCD2751680.1 LysE family translocator [Pseudomonas aeruginosa]MDV2800220.1 LysE family translocator [Pseudomonas aeruginosa]OPF28442.1 amino acid transporter membrane protein [Pseudomonas aeruginosa P47]